MNGLPECVFYSNGFCRNCSCLISVSLLGQLRRKWSYYKQNTWLQTSPQSFSGCWYETLVDSSLHILWFSPEMVNVNSSVYIYIFFQNRHNPHWSQHREEKDFLIVTRWSGRFFFPHGRIVFVVSEISRSWGIGELVQCLQWIQLHIIQE